MQNRIYTTFLLLFLLISAQAQIRLTPEGVKLDRTIRLINDLYVDDVDIKKITEAGIRSMLTELDPHSSYLDA